jgi:N4-gp56 family major capsid protein
MSNFLKKLWYRISDTFSTKVSNEVGLTDFSSVSDDAVLYIAEKTLMIAHKIVRFYEMADKAKLPSQSSKTFQYTRYERLALPQSALSDGVTPSDTSMTVTPVTAVSEQWGAVVTITDVAELTIRHKPLQKAINLLGVQSAETIDREIFKVLLGGTNVFYPGATAGRLNIASGDVLSSSVLAKIVSALRSYGAMGIDKPKGGPAEDPELGDDYAAVVDPYVEQDISTTDTDFKAANVYNNTKVLWNGEIGSWKGFRFVRSNLLPILTSAAAAVTADNTADNGTLVLNSSWRVMVTGVDDTFGYEKVIYQSSEQDTANDANNAHTITVTIPATAGFTYNIYASAVVALNGTTTATAMTLQGSGFAPSASIKIGSSVGTATATRLALTTTGAASPPQQNAAGSKVHLSFFIGKEAYTCVDLMNLQSTLTAPVATDSDPLIQRRKAGWKTMFKAVINNDNFFARCESESAFD